MSQYAGNIYKNYPNWTDVGNINKHELFNRLKKENTTDIFKHLKSIYNPMYSEWVTKYTIIDSNNVTIFKNPNASKILKIDTTNGFDMQQLNLDQVEEIDDISLGHFFAKLLEIEGNPNDAYYVFIRRIIEALFLDSADYLQSIRTFELTKERELTYVIDKFFGPMDEVTKFTNPIKILYSVGMVDKFFLLFNNPKAMSLSKINLPKDFDKLVSRIKTIANKQLGKNLLIELKKLSENEHYQSFVGGIFDIFSKQDFDVIKNILSITNLSDKFNPLLNNNINTFIQKYISLMDIKNKQTIEMINRYKLQLQQSTDGQSKSCSLFYNLIMKSVNKYGPFEAIDSLVKKIRTDKKKNNYIKQSDSSYDVLIKMYQYLIALDIDRNLYYSSFNDNVYDKVIHQAVDYVLHDTIPTINFNSNISKEYLSKLDHLSERYHKFDKKIKNISGKFSKDVSEIVNQYCDTSCCLNYSENKNNFTIYLCQKILDVLVSMKLIDHEDIDLLSVTPDSNIDLSNVSTIIDSINNEMRNDSETYVLIDFIFDIMKVFYNVSRVNNLFGTHVGTSIVAIYVSRLIKLEANFVDGANLMYVSKKTMLDNITRNLTEYNTRDKKIVSNTLINMGLTNYKPVGFTSVGVIQDCVESSIRDFINVAIHSGDDIDISLLPSSTLKEVKDFYQKYHNMQLQYNSINIRKEWLQLFNNTIKEKLLTRFPTKSVKDFYNTFRSQELCDFRSDFPHFVESLKIIFGFDFSEMPFIINTPNKQSKNYDSDYSDDYDDYESDDDNDDDDAHENEIQYFKQVNELKMIVSKLGSECSIQYKGDEVHVILNNVLLIIVKPGHTYSQIYVKKTSFEDIENVKSSIFDFEIDTILLDNYFLDIETIVFDNSRYFLLVFINSPTQLVTSTFPNQFLSDNILAIKKDIVKYGLVEKYLDVVFYYVSPAFLGKMENYVAYTDYLDLGFHLLEDLDPGETSDFDSKNDDYDEHKLTQKMFIDRYFVIQQLSGGSEEYFFYKKLLKDISDKTILVKLLQYIINSNNNELDTIMIITAHSTEIIDLTTEMVSSLDNGNINIYKILLNSRFFEEIIQPNNVENKNEIMSRVDNLYYYLLKNVISIRKFYDVGSMKPEYIDMVQIGQIDDKVIQSFHSLIYNNRNNDNNMYWFQNTDDTYTPINVLILVYKSFQNFEPDDLSELDFSLDEFLDSIINTAEYNDIINYANKLKRLLALFRENKEITISSVMVDTHGGYYRYKYYKYINKIKHILNKPISEPIQY